MKRELINALPILEVDNDCIISKMGDVTVGFEIIKPEIFTLSAQDFETLHQSWVKAIKVLPYHCILHMQDWYIREKYEADLEKAGNNFLARASDLHFNERSRMKHHCHAYLTKMPKDRKMPDSALSSLFRSNLVPKSTLDPLAIREFGNTASRFDSILKAGGLLQSRRLTADELVSSPNQPGLIEQYYFLQAGHAGPVVSDISFDEALFPGDLYCTIHTLADAEALPSQCSACMDYAPYSTERTRFHIGFASGLGLLLPYDHIYNQYIVIEDPQITRKDMEKRSRRLHSVSAHSRENAATRDAIDQYLQEAISGQRQMVKAHFNVYAWTDNLDRLHELKNKLSSAIVQMGATPHEEIVGRPQLWWAGIPGNAAELPTNETFDTFAEQAACFLIPETNYQSSISPFGIRLGDRITGIPLHVDISDEPMRKGKIFNRNKFVLGGSGSGKSFFMNHLVRSYYEQEAHILIVDIGNSYKGLCSFVGGYYFTYTEAKPIRFNPFWLPEGEILDTEKKESIKTLLLALWKKDDEAFLRSEYVALSNALQLYYEKLARNKEIFPCFNSFYEFLQGEFVLVLENDRVKEKDFDISNFLYVLRPFYTGGEYDYLLNAQENLDLVRQRFIVFELDAIQNHPTLFLVVTIILAELFISKMRKLPGIRKVICIEEAWKAIARQGMSEYIKYLFKTVRKFFGEAIVVTQEIEDIISSPVVKQTIINNADCKILLDQSKFQNRFDQIQDLLGLSEKEKSLVLSVNKDNDPALKYKEVFISLGNSCSKVYRTEVSLEEYLTYTTEESEKLQVEQYAIKYGSYAKGIEALAKEIRNRQN